MKKMVGAILTMGSSSVSGKNNWFSGSKGFKRDLNFRYFS